LKTTKRHFEIFKKECKKWIEIFGLKEWSYYFFHDNWDEKNRASVIYNVVKRTVSINLETKWNTPPTVNDIKITAFHEVCEVLLGPIYLIAESRSFDSSDLDSQCHSIIRRLENSLFKFDQGGKRK
jgi:hypothetical protein